MISPLLILGPAIGGTQVERVEGPHVVLHAKRNADEAARPLAGARGRRAGQFSLDDAVIELEALDGGGLLDVTGRAQAPPGFFGHRQPQPFLAVQRGRLGGQIVQAKASGGFERVLLDLTLARFGT